MGTTLRHLLGGSEDITLRVTVERTEDKRNGFRHTTQGIQSEATTTDDT